MLEGGAQLSKGDTVCLRILDERGSRHEEDEISRLMMTSLLFRFGDFGVDRVVEKAEQRINQLV